MREVGNSEAGTDTATEAAGGTVVMGVFRLVMLVVSFARLAMLMFVRTRFHCQCRRHRESDGRAGDQGQRGEQEK